jgi:hypothetical protein
MVLTFTAIYCRASDIYIAQAAAGGNSGADCADAHAMTFFNTSSNWASTATTGKISPGTTVHLCGTFTAPAGSNSYLQFKGSGISGSPITLIFESGAVLTAPYWSGPAIDANGESWLVINGNNTGTIQATANGTSLANQQDSGIGVGSAMACPNCTVENLTISNMYVHACPGTVSSCDDEGGQNTYGIRFVSGSNVTLSGNTVHDAKWCILFAFGAPSSGIQISGNTIYNCDHGVVFGDASAGSTGTGSIFGNDISNMSSWDDAGDENHHDGIHTWVNFTGSSYTVQVYNNYLHGNGGANFNAWVGMEANGIGSSVFNNVVNMQSNCVGGVGLIGLFSGGGAYGSGIGVYNNTIQGNGPSDNCEGLGIQEQTGGTLVKNNIVQNVGTFIYIPTSGQIAASGINNNVWYNSSNGFWCPGEVEVSFSSWQSTCGFDALGAEGNPKLNSSFVPTSGSPAINTAANLTTLGVTPLDQDKAGVNRQPPALMWTAGAYQASGPAAPTNVTGTPSP